MSLSRLKGIWRTVLGLFLLAALASGTWWIVQVALSALSGLDKGVLAALVTGTLVAAGAIWVKHIEHRHSVEAQFRDAKVKLFNELMDALDKVATKDIAAEKLLGVLKESKRRMLFWGGPKVMNGFLSLSEFGGESKSVGDMARGLEAMGDLILAMRKDVGLSNRGIVAGSMKGISKATVFGARYMLRHPDLFLDCLQKDPSTAIEHLTDLEAALNARKGLPS